MKRALLINPPIYDFTAYDFWLKPYGLLKIAGRLKASGWNVEFFDFTFRQAGKEPVKDDIYGRGHFPERVVEKPEILRFVPRYFRRFGAGERRFLTEFEGKTFDLIMITCTMTYWYPGVLEVLNLLKKAKVKGDIVIGGNYVIFEREHAEKTFGETAVVADDLKVLESITGVSFDRVEEEVAAWELYPRLRYGVTRLTYGCVYRCTYCGVNTIFPAGFKKLSADVVKEEIELLYRTGARDVAFYDDALLEAGIDFIENVLSGFIKKGLRFHTPNALHARRIDKKAAHFLKQMNFETVFLGFEFGRNDVHRRTGGKVKVEECERAVTYLKEAGYTSDRIVLYVMMGHPLQEIELLKEDILRASRLGVRIMLSEFSPVRGTPDGDLAIQQFQLDDPLLTNKTAFTVKRYGWEGVCEVKLLAKKVNENWQKAAG